MYSEELSELIGTLSVTADRLTDLVRDLSDQDLRRQGSEGEFSVIENVCHLRDIEAEGYAARLSRIISEDRPSLPDIDGSRLAIERAYNSQNIEHALRGFAAARQRNVTLLRGLQATQFERRGILEGVGELTLHQLMLMMCEHDAGHIEDLRGLRRRAKLISGSAGSLAC